MKVKIIQSNNFKDLEAKMNLWFVANNVRIDATRVQVLDNDEMVTAVITTESC